MLSLASIRRSSPRRRFAGLSLLCCCAFAAACVAEPASHRARRAALTADAGAQPACGAVTYAGCCADQTLLYCVAGALQLERCTASAPCAWSATHGLYRCGPGPASDPSGVAPRDCPAADGGPAADGVVADALGDGPTGDTAAPTSCGPFTQQGCCAGDELLFCSSDTVLSLACAAGTCGWNEAARFYDCDTAGSSGPAEFPHSCETLLGDGGLPFGDAGPDAGVDAGSAADAAGDRGPHRDGRAGGDAFVVGGDGRPRVDTRPTDGGPHDLRGLDAVGLEGSTVDGGSGEGDGGCSCGTAPALPAAPSFVTALLALAAARRRRR